MPDHKDWKPKAQTLLNSAQDLLSQAENPAIKLLANQLPPTITAPAGPVTIALAGAYSSGKSTLLKALTGYPDIAIGAGITTETLQTLPWENALLIDTPGLHTEIRPDHDATAYQALTSADLLLFLITNELFDSAMIGHFNQLAEARDKGAETLLIVNKMSRHALGNSPEAQEVIKKDLAQVLPALPQENIAFIDARDAVAAAETPDPERRERLLQRSNFAACAAHIKDFLHKTGAAAQQTTPLYQIESLLNQAQELTNPNLNEWLLQTEDQLRQHQEIIAAAIDSWTTQAENFLHQAQAKIQALQEKALALYAANGVIAPADENELSAQIQDIAHRLHDHIIESFNNHAQKMQADLHRLWQNERIEYAMDGLSSHFDQKGPGLSFHAAAKPLPGILRTAAHQAGELTSLSGVSGSVMHEGVLAVGHFFGKSFHPWEAIKIARGLGTAAAIAGPILTVVLQVWEDHQETQKQNQMQQHRREIFQIFQAAGAALEEDTHKNLQALRQAWETQTLEAVSAEIEKTVQARRDHQRWQEQLNQLKADLQQLIRNLHRPQKGAAA